MKLGVETCLSVDDKVRCETCLKYGSQVNPVEWITLKVFRSLHQKSATHLRALDMKKREEEAQERRLQDTPDFFAASHNIEVVNSTSQWVSRCSLPHNPIQNLWDGFDGTFELDGRLDKAHKAAQKKFEADFSKYVQWDGLEHITSDTNMLNVEQSWEEEEQDNLLSELLEQIGMSLGCY